MCIVPQQKIARQKIPWFVEVSVQANLVTGDGPASQNFVLTWQTPHQGARYGDVSRVSVSTVRTHYPTVNLGRGDKLSKTQRSVGATETKRVSQCCSRFRTKKRLRRQRHVVHVKVFLWVYAMQVQCGRDHTLRIENERKIQRISIQGIIKLCKGTHRHRMRHWMGFEGTLSRLATSFCL